MTSLWRHSRLTYYDLGPNFLTHGVELLPGGVWQVSKRNSQYFRSYLRKTTGGALWAPPPSGARVNGGKLLPNARKLYLHIKCYSYVQNNVGEAAENHRSTAPWRDVERASGATAARPSLTSPRVRNYVYLQMCLIYTRIILVYALMCTTVQVFFFFQS